ncbi:MAG: MarR family transcriptional regulator [Chloroflexi bacterium]|nr:MarR family transcriptional regulator [Chloroflexota bacterium]
MANTQDIPGEEWFGDLKFRDLSEEAVLNVIRTYSVLAQQFARHFGGFDLTAPKYNTLSILRATDGKGLELNEIGDRLVVSRPNITGIVDRLERDGLAYRDSDPTDRRKKVAKISEKGLMLLQEVRKTHYQAIDKMAEGLSDEEKQQLVYLLTKLRRGRQNSK